MGGVCRASGGVFCRRAERLFPHGAAESDRVGDGNGPTLETVDSTGSCRELSLSEAVRYGTALVRRGIAYVDRGIEAYLSRLDMRFGKIRALGEIGDYGRYDEAKPLC